MFFDIDYTETINDLYGRVEFVEHVSSDDPRLTPRARAAIEMARGTWLITAPAYHPGWSQYVLSVISLADHPDLEPAVLKFDGATHELLLVAVRGDKPQTVETVRAHGIDGQLPFLTPVNIAEQFECSDDEIRALAWLAARGVVTGVLNPETGDAPARVREQWLSTCTKTLAHFRGEAHAS